MKFVRMRMKRRREGEETPRPIRRERNLWAATQPGKVRRMGEISPTVDQRGDNCPPSSLTPNVASNSTPNLLRTALSDSTRLEIWESAIN